jgi:hypothetical protein
MPKELIWPTLRTGWTLRQGGPYQGGPYVWTWGPYLGTGRTMNRDEVDSDQDLKNN